MHADEYSTSKMVHHVIWSIKAWTKCWNFADDILICIFLDETYSVLSWISVDSKFSVSWGMQCLQNSIGTSTFADVSYLMADVEAKFFV